MNNIYQKLVPNVSNVSISSIGFFWSINEKRTSENEIEKGRSWSLLGTHLEILVKGTPARSRTDRWKMEPLKNPLQKMAQKKIPGFTGVKNISPPQKKEVEQCHPTYNW